MENLNIIKPKSVQGIINKFCFTIGMIPTSYKLSLTYEEQILAIGQYLEETVYPAINNNAEALAELQGLFADLRKYVDTYFDDLDIQTEINNKIESMLEDNTFPQIILNYVYGNVVQGFNNIQQMQNSESLIEGSFALTFGKITLNDGFPSLFKIKIYENEIIDNETIYKIGQQETPELIAIKINFSEIDNIKNSIQNLDNNSLKNIQHLYGSWIPYYIDAYNGNDNNNGLSANTAFKTFKGLIDNVINKGKTNILARFKGNYTYTIEGAFLQNIAIHFESYEGTTTFNIDSPFDTFAVYNCHLNFKGTELNNFIITGIEQFYLDSGFIILNYTKFNNCKFTLNGASSEANNCDFNTISCNEGIGTFNRCSIGGVESNNGKLYFNTTTFETNKKIRNTRNSFMQLAASIIFITGANYVDTSAIHEDYQNFLNSSNSFLTFSSGFGNTGGNKFSGTNTISNGVLTISQARYNTLKNLVDGTTTFSNGALYTTEIIP